MRLAVAGASGYVGGRLVRRLVADGHDVVAFSRRPPEGPMLQGARSAVVDAADEDALGAALDGIETAYYLVHSMAEGSRFDDTDQHLAQSFRQACATAGVGRIVYLGGLGSDDLSAHLASRQAVGATLADGPVPVVELRAAIILGSGSISFEMLRYLTERLPAMVCPQWISTRIQPIAEADLLDRLVGSLDVEPGVYEIGGPEVTTYRAMIASYARVRGLHRRRILDVPLLTPRLSARWVDLVTPVERTVSHTLIESLATEVIVHDQRAETAFGAATVGVDDAIRAALDDQASALPDELFELHPGTRDGVFSMHEHAAVAPDDVDDVRAGLRNCGGDLRWYGLAVAWRLRLLLGRVFGERLHLQRPARMQVGAEVDWWTVDRLDESVLVLGTRRWFCGEAWLGYRVEGDDDGAQVRQSAALRPKGLPGVLYWWLLWPIHLVVFEVMAKRQAVVKRQAADAAAPSTPSTRGSGPGARPERVDEATRLSST